MANKSTVLKINWDGKGSQKTGESENLPILFTPRKGQGLNRVQPRRTVGVFVCIMATRLILIRHGSTDWNVKQRYSGFSDIALNDKGRVQARRLRRRLMNQVVHKVYSSDRKRAIQTAGIVFKGYDIVKVADLREMHFGIFEGLTYKQIMKRFPDTYKKWIESPFETVIPSGESLTILNKRVVRAFKKIILRHSNQTVAVVSHGGAISAFINHILKSKDFWAHIPQSASLTLMELRNNKFKINLLNDISHLSGIKIDVVKFKEN